MLSAVASMYADARDLPVVAILMVLPTIVSLPAITRGARVGLVAPAVLGAQILLWVVYYTTDLISNPGLAGGVGFALFPLPFVWATTAIAWLGLRRQPDAVPE